MSKGSSRDYYEDFRGLKKEGELYIQDIEHIDLQSMASESLVGGSAGF